MKRLAEHSMKSRRKRMGEQNNAGNDGSGRVGYGNPPMHSRFPKGKSGNPQGRPKGTLNMATVLERTLRERVVINENGVRKTVTKLEAAVKQLANKAASGELKALQLLSALVRTAEERDGSREVLNPVLEEPDQKVVMGILKRIEAANREKKEHES
jgi:hypothetical protein